MRCPICSAEQGDVAAIVARGYHCLACDKWPNSTWWHREDQRKQHEEPQREEAFDEVPFDRFHLVARLTDDDASTYYDARDGATPVRVRVCKQSSKELRSRLNALAQTVGSDHPSALGALAIGVFEQRLFVVTPKPAGVPLETQLDTPVPWPRAVAILIQLCHALRAAHAAGVVHRSLPSHVWTDGDRVTVDLFVPAPAALEQSSVGERHNWCHHDGSTPLRISYFSPEQLMGKPLEGRSDIYALGVIGYQLLTGRLPFPDAKGPAGLITAQLKQEPLPPGQLIEDLPVHVDHAIVRCLAKRRQDRFENVDEMVAMLEGSASIDPSHPARSREIDALAPGTVVERYRIEQLIRAGNATCTYEAVHLDSGRQVALRLVRPWLASEPSFVLGFDRAIAAHRSVRHAHVLHLEGAGWHFDGLYFATELVRRRRLSELLSTPLESAIALDLVRQLCRVYEAAHAANLALGLVPDEIYVVPTPPETSGTPYRNAAPARDALKLGLFAHLASRPQGRLHIDAPNRRITHELTLPSPAYQFVAPERIAIVGYSDDARSDVFALAVLAYMLLTGRAPFDGVKELRVARVTPARVPAAVLRGLSRFPVDRFADVASFAAALDLA